MPEAWRDGGVAVSPRLIAATVLAAGAAFVGALALAQGANDAPAAARPLGVPAVPLDLEASRSEQPSLGEAGTLPKLAGRQARKPNRPPHQL